MGGVARIKFRVNYLPMHFFLEDAYEKIERESPHIRSFHSNWLQTTKKKESKKIRVIISCAEFLFAWLCNAQSLRPQILPISSSF